MIPRAVSTEDIMIRQIKKPAGTIYDIYDSLNSMSTKQENLYHYVSQMDEMVIKLNQKIQDIEKEVSTIRKSISIIKEAEFL